jgi:hypothetical protein
MQAAQQGFDLLRIEHRRRDQKGRCTGRHQRGVGFEILLQRGLIRRRLLRRLLFKQPFCAFIWRIEVDGWIWAETQFQQRLLARLLVYLGLHSH